MYQVFCNTKNKKLVEYSGKLETKQQAEDCKLKAELQRVCNVHGELIKFKIKEV